MAPPTDQTLAVGLDTGGTYTDVVLYDLASRRVLRKAKTPTTHGDYTVCIGNALHNLALDADQKARLREGGDAQTMGLRQFLQAMMRHRSGNESSSSASPAPRPP